MCKVSILVPVYNTEKYLSKCLDSIMCQTLEDIEIIITNDGSSDNSQNIIEVYAQKDSRIKYSYQENSGLGATRNIGIDMARGEYIAFLDSDDWVEPNCYEIMYQCAKKNDSDLVISDYFIDSLNHSTIYKHILRTKEQNIGDIMTITHAFSWNKLYKRDMILKNQLSFPLRNDFENVEDQYFSIRCSFFANDIAYTQQPLIHYNVREGSIVNKYQKTLMYDCIELYRRNLQFFEEFNVKEKYINYLNSGFINQISQIISNELKRSNPNKMINKIKNIKKLIQVPEVNDLLRMINHKENNQINKNLISKENLFYANLMNYRLIILLTFIKLIRVKSIEVRLKKIK